MRIEDKNIHIKWTKKVQSHTLSEKIQSYTLCGKRRCDLKISEGGVAAILHTEWEMKMQSYTRNGGKGATLYTK